MWGNDIENDGTENIPEPEQQNVALCDLEIAQEISIFETKKVQQFNSDVPT